jgi:succinate-semialdehyde dehydrogenase/glutarate-semialdehyde dehydrogenase
MRGSRSAAVPRRSGDPILTGVLTEGFKVGSDLPLRAPQDPGTEAERLREPVRPHIDGAPSGGGGPEMTLVDPSTGEPTAVVLCAGPEDIQHAVDSAARSATLWRGTSFAERARLLRQLAALAYEQRYAIAQLIAREQGKPYPEALTLEVLPALDHLRFTIQHAERYHAGLAVEPRHPFYAHKHASYLYDPIGLVAVVTPSPLPFAVPLIQVAAALAMGNSVVLKPSERTPLSGLRVGELCTEVGFPAGLVNVVPALPEHAMHLVLHPRVEKVFVTGSLEAGQNINAMAGCAPRPVVLCLGGKHPSIVAGDADLARAARGIVWGALANAGQNCGAIERVYVVESAAATFLRHLLEVVDGIRTGGALEPGTDLGPLQSRERREAVHRQVREAAGAGAKVVRGGQIPGGPGFFYPPTVVLEPPADCRLLREETLGPVIPVVVTESLERALMLANESDFALSASGWTTSPQTAERMMAGLRAGVVTVNDVLYSFGEPAATWSGYRKSGMGQNHGTPGLREMSRQKFVSFDPSECEAPLFSFPYDEEHFEVVEAAVSYLNAGRSWRKLRALLTLLRLRRFRTRTPLRSLLGATRRHL